MTPSICLPTPSPGRRHGRRGLKSAIETTTGFQGITGAITFTPEQHVPQKGVTIIAVKDGKFTLGEANVVPSAVPAP